MGSSTKTDDMPIQLEGTKEFSKHFSQASTGCSTARSSTSTLVAEATNLRRVRDEVPWRLWTVAAIGFWERAAFWGITAPWQNYMEHAPHADGQRTPGALGLGQATATRLYCAFYIFYYSTPMLFAVLADSRSGRYRALVTSVVLYALGCTALTVSSTRGSIDKGWGLPGLIVAMVLIGLGGGGFRAIVVPFTIDQYTGAKTQLKQLKSGEQVVVDHKLTLQYICSIYYWVGNVGSLSWFATVYMEMHLGFIQAYGLTLGFIVAAMAMLIGGKRWYVKNNYRDNVLPQAAKIMLCAGRNGFRMARADPEYQLHCFNKITTWNAQLVNDLTRALRACRVLLAFVVFYICFDQMQNNLVSQAGQMETRGTPNDLLPAMNQVGCIVFGPLIQGVLYPCLHRRRIYLGPITRITIGFVFIALSMLYATVIQHAIYRSPPCYNQPGICGSNNVSVWLQAPLYLLIALGEIFAYVTALEYAHDHSPESMKVIVQAINLLVAGVGSAGAMALTSVAHDPQLVVFYASLTGGMAATTVVFWLVFRNESRQKPAVGDEAIRHDGPDSLQRRRLRDLQPSSNGLPLDASEGRKRSVARP